MTDDLTRAITSAFVLVVCADGDIAAKELDEFEHTLARLETHLPGLNFAQVRRLFSDIGGATLTDPVSGRAHALAAIESVRGNREQARMVKNAAEIAVAADNRTRAQETTALHEICSALDLSSSDLPD